MTQRNVHLKHSAKPVLKPATLARLKQLQSSAADVNGATPLNDPRRIDSQKLVRLLRRLVRQGHGERDLAAAMGLSTHAVHQRLRKAMLRGKPMTQAAGPRNQAQLTADHPQAVLIRQLLADIHAKRRGDPAIQGLFRQIAVIIGELKAEQYSYASIGTAAGRNSPAWASHTYRRFGT